MELTPDELQIVMGWYFVYQNEVNPALEDVTLAATIESVIGTDE